MPSKQPFSGERLRKVPGGIEHHFDNPFDATIDHVDTCYGKAKATGDGGTDLFNVELLALDLAALDRLFRQRFHDGFLLNRQSERFHAATQAPLLMAQSSEYAGDAVVVPTELGPIRAFVNVTDRSGHSS